MKILHTSDWHLGKYLDKYSRIDEQKKFIDELEKIAYKQNIDLMLIAGDIYDTVNPPVLAEKLFFDAMKRLSKICPIIMVSGNHDSPSKILSSRPLAYELGIIVQGELSTIAEVGKYDKFEIIKSGEGFLEIEIKGERAVIITLPYITEKLINEVIFNESNEQESQKEFSDKVKQILEELGKNYRDDTINILLTHLFIKGGIETNSERKIQSIGGTYAVDPNAFPENTQYVALGHLHRVQQVKTPDCLAYYSGSPIRYSQSEVGYEKVVLLVDINAGKTPTVTKISLKDYKPIYVIKNKTYDEVIKYCEDISSEDSYVFIEIVSKSYLTGEQIRTIREIKKDIISINVRFEQEKEDIYDELLEEKSILEQFKSFYLDKKGVNAPNEILDEFLDIIDEIEREEISLNETDNA